MPVPPLPYPALPCPECRLNGYGGDARIGNRRSRGCVTCNTFAQRVMRLTRKRLREAHQEEYIQIQMVVEKDLYPQVIDEFSDRLRIPREMSEIAFGEEVDDDL